MEEKEVVYGKALQERLASATPRVVSGAETKYEFGPFLPKTLWTDVGDKVVKAERLQTFNVPGDKYISLRLDGHGFSKLTRMLKRDNILEQGFSPTMASWMQQCCVSLMEFVCAKYGYTQSDEITVIIPPASVTTKGDVTTQQPHMFNGRVLKISTLAASHVTLVFNQCLAKTSAANWQEYTCVFDCRMGAYDTLEEAQSLLLWRSYDCSVNGISDACLHQKGKIDGAKAAIGLPTDKKISFLLEHDVLPLHPHQAHGSYYTRVKRVKTVTNPQTGEPVVCLRSVIEKVEGNLLNLAARGELTRKDEELP